tara:strand:+ start:938 stop:1780 length:843 start_codon:yes stop_codon:yes gene_type:complete
MSEAQGVEAETNDAPVNENEAEQVAVETEAVVENEETVQEPVDLDYEAEYSKAKSANEAMQKKIDRQRAASSQHNAKIQELSTQLSKLQQVEAPTEPSIDAFDTHDEYVNALADFRAEGVVREKQKAMVQEQQQQAFEQKQAEDKKVFDQQEATYREENPDYSRSRKELEEHMAVFHTDMGSNKAADAIYTAAELTGSIPSIIDYFGKDGGANLPEFDRISSLTPAEAMWEVFKIAQGKDGATKTKTKPLPKPAKTVKGSNAQKKDLSQGDVLKNLGLKS